MYPARVWLVKFVFLLCVSLLMYRMVELQLFYPYSEDIQQIKNSRLSQDGLGSNRLSIVDRNGDTLASSIENYNLYLDPNKFKKNSELTRALWLDYLKSTNKLRASFELESALGTRLVATGLTGAETEYLLSFNLHGVWADRYYRRYYPGGEAIANLVGLVDAENKGIEGLEYRYDAVLHDQPPTLRGLRDGRGDLMQVHADSGLANPKSRQGLALSVDLRLQHIAYQRLLEGAKKHKADSGIILTLDSHSGEVLALAQYPSFNPNNRRKLRHDAVRNRALTDLFEPGSTMKPLILASALQTKRWTLEHEVNTRPGYIKIGDVTIRDNRNNGKLSLEDVIAKSSNVGIARFSGDIDSRVLVDSLYRLGIGRLTGSDFPGEREGHLPQPSLSKISKAVLSYGYGVSMTAMQLAKAYGIIANNGKDFYVHLLKQDDASKRRNKAGQIQVLDEGVAKQVHRVLAKAASSRGTGAKSQVAGYSIAGKTGTVHKFENGDYSSNKYRAVFVGMTPATNPRYVTLVLLDEPKTNNYYGGEVAAPIFASYMKDFFRIYSIPPDDKTDKI